MTRPTLMKLAREGIVAPEIKDVAVGEDVEIGFVMERLADGRIVIPANVRHYGLKPIGIGEGLRIKVNVNLGRSSEASCLSEEIEKVKVAIRYGADTVMDLSTGEDIDNIRQTVLAESPLPVGTVPIYQAAERVSDIRDLKEEDFIEVIRKQAEDGVDFMTIHAGVLLAHMGLLEKRVTGIVSRGGAIIAKWMEYHERENPLYTHFDQILEIASKWDVTLSLGDGLRPGCLHDASDDAQFAELAVLGELAERAREAGVQVMIEGPGHVPFSQIVENVKKQKELCNGAPFYVLGPLVTDIAPGYDHITGAIGATMAAIAGADFLCYVTPKEHLGLPNTEDVRQGLIAFKIAAHAADIARGIKKARDRDDEMARARFAFDWERQFALALDPDRAREYHKGGSINYVESEFCSMCGPKFCPMKVMKDKKVATL